jgi:hypothetical protein
MLPAGTRIWPAGRCPGGANCRRREMSVGRMVGAFERSRTVRRRIGGLFIGVLAMCATLSSAGALTVEEEQQLDALFNQAADVSAGGKVGGATIAAEGGWMLRGEEACTYSRLLNADVVCGTEAIVFPPEGVGIDSIYFGAPEDIGHVNMDDWTEDVNTQIDEIWDSYVEGAKAQSERIGYQVVPVRWVLYPTLNRAARVMTYGILLDFGGDEVINLVNVKFTRSGYVVMEVVTNDALLAASSASFDSVSVYAADTYKPGMGLRYADFRDGDKVAAIGAVGVLASVIGVKHSKGWLAAAGGMILVFAKKFWFLLLAIPAAIWGGIKKLTGGG